MISDRWVAGSQRELTVFGGRAAERVELAAPSQQVFSEWQDALEEAFEVILGAV
jgi:hypothetical protein